MNNVKLSVISDMDGVIYRSKKLIAGALKFVQNLKARGTSFLFLTNNSEQTPLDLSRKLSSMGLEGVSPDNFVTASEVTAHFLSKYHKGGSVFVIGGSHIQPPRDGRENIFLFFGRFYFQLFRRKNFQSFLINPYVNFLARFNRFAVHV